VCIDEKIMQALEVKFIGFSQHHGSTKVCQWRTDKLHSQSHMLPNMNFMHMLFDFALLCHLKEVKKAERTSSIQTFEWKYVCHIVS
jgi:hypothetical protein